MHIQWFPGHMTKALRMMESNLKVIDSIVYVLDARAISACINHKFDKIIGHRPVLYVLNKCDMVERAELDRWEKYFKAQGLNYVISNSISNKHVKSVIDKLAKINSELVDRYLAKGVNRMIRAMVIGVPNTGKSTLINSLCRGKRTTTGNKAGVTRGKQWVRIENNIDLLDTPGTMSPNIYDQEKAIHLAFIGSVNEDILDFSELAFELIKWLMLNKKKQLLARYELEDKYTETLEIIDAIAIKRGLIMKKAQIDYERTARVIIDDFRKLRIGKIMLEKADVEL